MGARPVRRIFYGLALIGPVLYAIGITARYPLAVGLNYPGASWAILSNFAPDAVVLHAIVYALEMLCYALALRVALRSNSNINSSKTALATRHLIGLVIGGWLISSIVLLNAYPGDSTDIFDYLFRGRMLAEYGHSPLAIVPAQVSGYPFYAYVHWANNVDTYGPLWEYESGAIAVSVRMVAHLLGLRDIPLAFYIIGYRLLAICLAGLCGIPIAALVHQRNPQHVPAALLAWFWNPLLLTATAIGAHNDMLMLLLALIGLWFLQHQRWVLALLAVLLAAHVKITALLLLPLMLLHIVGQLGWRRAIWHSSIAFLMIVPISWLLYAPLGGWATLPRMLEERVRFLVNSWAFVAYWLLQIAFGWTEVAAWRITTQAATLLFCVLACIQLWRFWREYRQQGDGDAWLWQRLTIFVFIYLAVGSFWFEHWYVLWALVPAVLLPQHQLSQRILPWVCLGVLWLNLAADFFVTAHPVLVAPPPPLWATPLLLISIVATIATCYQTTRFR